MSQLFARLYLDEDVDVLIAALMQARGFQASTTLEQGQVGATDAVQLEFATSIGAVLVSHNRLDFERLVEQWFASGHQHAGIILSVRRPPHEIADRLLDVVNAITADELRNQIVYI